MGCALSTEGAAGAANGTVEIESVQEENGVRTTENERVPAGDEVASAQKENNFRDAKNEPVPAGDEIASAQKENVFRTAKCDPVLALDALKMLKDGNKRFVKGETALSSDSTDLRQALASHGQLPYAAVIGCADSRCPVETLFDAKPGDIFVLRNAGNTVTQAEGSFVGSLEYCVGALRTRLILVLGHTRCGAIVGATSAMLAAKGSTSGGKKKSVLDNLLGDLGEVAMQAQQELGENATEKAIAEHAVKVNVLRSMDRLLELSDALREQVRVGDVLIRGGIYDLESGQVTFLNDFRTAKCEPVPAGDALKMLQDGNQRFVNGESDLPTVGTDLRQTLASHGQLPYAAVIGCADSRCPVETLFDAKLGDIFVLRSAGNTCTQAEGSFVGSLEYCVGALRTRLILVLGHTRCGAIVGATSAMLAAKGSTSGGRKKSVLDNLLGDLGEVAVQAQKELGENATEEVIAAHAVKVNVLRNMDRLLELSDALREQVRVGAVQIHGGIYDLDSGRVTFLGQLSKQQLSVGPKDNFDDTLAGA